MSSTNLLRNAKPVNVREAQAQLSKLIRSKSPSMVLSHGKPVSFLVPYDDMLDLVEALDELKDQQLLKEIERARTEYVRGGAVPADYQAAIVAAIRALGANPRPEGKRTNRLTGQIIISRFTAEYRLRIGPYRVLYDVDDQNKKVVLLKLAKRDEQTYR